MCTYTIIENKKKKQVGVRSVEVVSYFFFCDGQWVEKTYGSYLTTNRFRSIADEDVQLVRTHIRRNHERLQSIHCKYIIIYLRMFQFNPLI